MTYPHTLTYPHTPERKERLKMWGEAIVSALADHNVKAVPGLLIAMSADGFGHEAEQWRRRMLDGCAIAAEAGER